MVRIGDTVVIMSAPGMFTVVAIDGQEVTIESAAGAQKIVLMQAVRTIAMAAPH
ncbi:MAG: hypothetical protein HYR72_00625 [Deltaproteobacteria bacterium]|nr:hypothetical protein [Deltaproteobacteria bacterium]MBI3389466.1 hypothetical protein [Deltaproteobacteria bacterium]